MRELTVDAAAACEQQYASEPIVILEVEWTTGTRRYADKAVLGATARLTSVGAVTWSKKQDNVGTVGAVNVELDDFDGSFKTMLSTTRIEGVTAKLYLHFEGNLESDLILLVKGRVAGPVTWAEGKRTITFSVETKVHDRQLGYEPPEGVYATDEAWPLSYGNVVHSKALLITKGASCVTTSVLKTTNTYVDCAGTEDFPKETFIYVEIDGYIFSGQFVGDRFYISEANLPKWENLALAARPEGDIHEDIGTICWLQNYLPINNNYVYIRRGSTTTVARVVRQHGKEIFLGNIAKGINVLGEPLGLGDTILQVAKHGRAGWTTGADASLFQAGSWALPNVDWNISAGTAVKWWRKDVPNVYVCNIIPGTIVSVWGTQGSAFRNIPSTLYSKGTLSVDGLTCTILSFPVPLSEAGWSDEVYVCMRSSVGPNVVDVLEHLFDTWSDLVPDATSFAAVKTKVANYPIGFTLHDRQNTIAACEEIAWQSRIGLVVEGTTVKLKYLSERPTADMSVDEDVIENKTVEIATTSIEDIVTRFKATWKKDEHQQKPGKAVYERNINEFGLIEREHDFYTYNIESLVRKSARFWAKRLGESWKVARFTAPMDAVALELFDAITLDLTDTTVFGIAGLLSVVQGHATGTEPNKTDVQADLWLPVVVGTNVEDPDAWMSDEGDVWPGDPTGAFGEVAEDVTLADDEGKLFGATDTGSPNRGFGQVCIVDYGAKDGEYIYDVYGNGKDQPPTETNVVGQVAYPDKRHPVTSKEAANPETSEAEQRKAGDFLPLIQNQTATGKPILPASADGTIIDRLIDNGSSKFELAPCVVTDLGEIGAGWCKVNTYNNGIVSLSNKNAQATLRDARAYFVDPTMPTPGVGECGFAFKQCSKTFFVPNVTCVVKYCKINQRIEGGIDGLYYAWELESANSDTIIEDPDAPFGTIPIIETTGDNEIAHGTKVTAFLGRAKNILPTVQPDLGWWWFFTNVSSGGGQPARITVAVGGGAYTVQRFTSTGDFGDPVTAYEMNDTVGITVGTKIMISKSGSKWYFFFPIEACN